MAKYISLLVFVAIVAAVALSAGTFEPGAWYDGLAKPEWTPPKWVFPVVWPILYVMIAVAGWNVWRFHGLGLPLAVWFVQLGLNAAWSYYMFGINRIDLAMFDIAAMWLAILAFIVLTWRVSRSAALLFVPYLAWVSYAAALNFAIWQLNA